jgi:hypothetical protein
MVIGVVAYGKAVEARDKEAKAAAATAPAAPDGPK